MSDTDHLIFAGYLVQIMEVYQMPQMLISIVSSEKPRQESLNED